MASSARCCASEIPITVPPIAGARRPDHPARTGASHKRGTSTKGPAARALASRVLSRITQVAPRGTAVGATSWPPMSRVTSPSRTREPRPGPGPASPGRRPTRAGLRLREELLRARLQFSPSRLPVEAFLSVYSFEGNATWSETLSLLRMKTRIRAGCAHRAVSFYLWPPWWSLPDAS